MLDSVTNKIPTKTKTSILYINDLHGQNIRMERLYNAVNQFDTFEPSEKTDKHE